MNIVTTWQGLEPALKGHVVAMGNFDGLHKGHQVVIAEAAKIAQAKNMPLGVILFRPHPYRFFNPDAEPFRLMSARLLQELLADMGVNALYEIPFNRDLTAMDDEAFCSRVLHEGLGVSHVVTGEDFKFGKGRCGDVTSLATHGETLGFGATALPLIGNFEKYGSSQIRKALQKGNVFHAAHMLGRPWIVDGIVQRGDQIGRTIGFPTANVHWGERLIPKDGIYSAEVKIGDDAHWRPAAAYVGRRPTLADNEQRLEVFIMDFESDIYGEYIQIALRTFIREDAAFDGLDALKDQMQQDIRAAKAVFGML